MCPHISNVQVPKRFYRHTLACFSHQCSALIQFAFRAPCCNRWFDCSECHFELSDHAITAAPELAFVCKRCRGSFRKDLTKFGPKDDSCPHCGLLLVVPAETPTSRASSTASADERVVA